MASLQELTDKIYAEGVEKGKEQAAAIVAQAEQKAAEILAAAEKEAAEKVAAAEKKAGELDKNARAELKLYAGQAVEAIKTEVLNLLSDRLATQAVREGVNENIMQQVVADLVSKMAENQAVVIEAKDAEALKAYFVKNCKALLDGKVEIKQVSGKVADFTIVPAQGGYKLAFGEQEFVEYFKDFLRPELKEILF